MSARRAGWPLVALGAALVLLSSLVWLLGRPREVPKPTPSAGVTQEPFFFLDLRGRAVRGYLADGTLLFEASVESARYQEQSQQATLTGVDCRLLREGKVAAQVIAERLEVRFREKQLFFSGEVTAASQMGPARLKAVSLVWLYDQDRLVSEQPVVVSLGGVSAQGAKFEADTALRRARLYGGASFVVAGPLPRRAPKSGAPASRGLAERVD